MAGKGTDGRSRGHELVETYFRLAPVTVPLYAVLVAVVVGSVVILLAGANPVEAYGALFEGAFGTPERIAQTLARSTPFIIASLAVAFAFKAGLFNIGAEGQLIVGATAGAWVGTWGLVEGTPTVLAVALLLGVGTLAGGLYGAVPGMLKARTGAHEVITTIMLNNIAALLLGWVVTSRDPVLLLDATASTSRTKPIFPAARMPELVADTGLHAGFLIALVLCAMVWFVLQRTTPGFELRTVGLNPNAAHYAGMSVNRTIVLVMAGSGALAGIAGAAEVAGATNGTFTPGVFANIGFDSIAIALLARSNPFAIIPAGILWGALLSGAPLMQLQADLSIDLVQIVQALIVLFVAADAIVRWIFRIRAPEGAEAGGGQVFASGWGSA